MVWWTGAAQLGEGVRVVQCGGHFPGSSVLHWAGGAGGKGLVLTSDTAMVALDRRGFAFMWSYPNMVRAPTAYAWTCSLQIPLEPAAVLGIQRALAPLRYDAASSAWPGKFIRSGAKEAFERSVEMYLGKIGWCVQGGQLVAVPQ